ncbi:hypothetical protein ABFS82_06G136600 [Erythranthe guttata]|uniref:Cystatin domain-containing protein n=1 Tax=Erythranthe guttata TaxID=4155 RepID=A0A022Q1B1_ERYGU|nr:PREDICTED: uncharacterized protein LOC105974891 isoform X2 [Erythranthe guttata]EYU22332.1 hypothetical protein MIMGU_mgv1a012541mg [Erythranthe guttata]|eukprot:XP_012855505.1 PREDICTED: uncharacterized protein LOC105974891 isoform X2 [Erythranthe guttata]
MGFENDDWRYTGPWDSEEDDDSDSDSDEKPVTTIDEIERLLNNLVLDTEKLVTDEDKAEKFKFRFHKILKQFNKLKEGESGSESESEPESEPELEQDKYEEYEREQERELELVEELTIDDSNNPNPFRVKRPMTKGGTQFPCGGFYVMYEPELTGNNPRAVEKALNSANLAIDFFNNQNNTKYSLVDVVGAIASHCAGEVVELGFTAIQPGDVDAADFKAQIYYGIGKTQVQYVIQ